MKEHAGFEPTQPDVHQVFEQPIPAMHTEEPVQPPLLAPGERQAMSRTELPFGSEVPEVADVIVVALRVTEGLTEKPLKVGGEFTVTVVEHPGAVPHALQQVAGSEMVKVPPAAYVWAADAEQQPPQIASDAPSPHEIERLP